jgi:hypothetical protein
VSSISPRQTPSSKQTPRGISKKSPPRWPEQLCLAIAPNNVYSDTCPPGGSGGGGAARARPLLVTKEGQQRLMKTIIDLSILPLGGRQQV